MRILVSGEKNNAAIERRVVFVLNWLGEHFKKADSIVEVAVVGDGVMLKNVLSFPAPVDFPHPDTKEAPLGEIRINPDYIARAGEDFDYMLIHAFLHLLGYDHKTGADAEKMEKLEKELLALIKIG